MREFFVFDVESIGLHGQAFAVGGGIYQEDGTAIREFLFSFPRENAIGAASDRDWVNANVPKMDITHSDSRGIREAFWSEAMEAKKRPGILFAAECGFPVEARFVASCIDDGEGRCWSWPFPLHEIASVMFIAGIDPVAHYDRLPGESPVHNPLCDSRQSMRMLKMSLDRLRNAKG